MQAKNGNYDFEKSLERIDNILSNSSSFPEVTKVPVANRMSYDNGFYVNCSAIFVDICDSSKMTDVHKRPTLAKMYRAFISEMVALFNGFDACRDISINGDCVWAVFDATSDEQVNAVFSASYMANSLVNALNYKFAKKGYSQISVTIGIDTGRALAVQAGYKTSGINDIIWMGDVVNTACHLCSANRGEGVGNTILTPAVYSKLSSANKKLCKPLRSGNFHSDSICVYMNDWLEQQK